MRDKPSTPPRQKKAAYQGEVCHGQEAVPSATERGPEPTAEEKKRILKDRAKALAHELPREEEAGEMFEVVEFQLAYETYAIESRFVQEVYPLKDFTPMPCTPAFVLGIINVRGQILSIIDIKKFFDLPEKGLGDFNKILILQNGKMEFGIVADVILGVRWIRSREVQPSLPTLTGVRADYLKGVTRERLAILDGEKLLSDKNMVVHEYVGGNPVHSP